MPLLASARWVDDTLLYASDGAEIRVSTVFTCMDYARLEDSLPKLWETTIFWPGNSLTGWIHSYTSRPAARAGHKAAVALVKAALGNSYSG
jgi:hypothetical protein